MAGGGDVDARAAPPLKQVRQRSAPQLIVGVEPAQLGDRLAIAGEPPHHLGDHVEQLSRHRDDAFAVHLRRRDHQQSDDLAGGPLVLTDTQMRQLGQLLDSHAGVPQRLDDRPLPEGGFLQCADVDDLAGGLVDCPDGPLLVPGAFAVGGRQVAPVGLAGHGEETVFRRRGRLFQQGFGVLVPLLDVGHQHR